VDPHGGGAELAAGNHGLSFNYELIRTGQPFPRRQPTTANRIGSRYRLHPISGKSTESEVSDGARLDSV
jgi:hypothetical protein